MKIQPITITRIKFLMLFEETIGVYSENQMKTIKTLCGKSAELVVKAGGAYNYH
jgi:hypothetical protein